MSISLSSNELHELLLILSSPEEGESLSRRSLRRKAHALLAAEAPMTLAQPNIELMTPPATPDHFDSPRLLIFPSPPVVTHVDHSEALSRAPASPSIPDTDVSQNASPVLGFSMDPADRSVISGSPILGLSSNNTYARDADIPEEDFWRDDSLDRDEEFDQGGRNKGYGGGNGDGEDVSEDGSMEGLNGGIGGSGDGGDDGRDNGREGDGVGDHSELDEEAEERPKKRPRQEEQQKSGTRGRVRTKRKRCPRGSGIVWKATTALPVGSYSVQSRTLIAKLVTESERHQPMDASNWAFAISSYLHDSATQSESLDSTKLLNISSINGLVKQIHTLNIKTEIVRLELQRSVPADDVHNTITVNDVIQHISTSEPLGVPNKTFENWLSRGRKYSALAAAGSVYLLWMIAGIQAGMLSGNLLEQDINHICSLLHAPATANILPTLVETRKRHPFKILHFFDSAFLLPGESEDLDFTDVESTHQILSRLKRNEFQPPARELGSWHQFLNGEIPSRSSVDLYAANARALGLEGFAQAPPPQLRDMQREFMLKLSDSSNHGVILCCSRFNDEHEEHNKPMHAHFNRRCVMTVKERRRASQAVMVQGLNDLRKQLLSFYRSTGKKPQSKYLQIPYNEHVHIDDRPLLVKTSTDKLLFIRGTLPDHLKANLLVKVTTIFGDLRSRNGEEDWTWTSIHFDYYNRYSTHGYDAPTDVHPRNLTKWGKKRANPSLFLPRPSAEMKRFPREYSTLQELFGELERLLPEEYKIEKMFAEFLPGGEPSPVFPFSGIVINLNVQTIIHRDSEDVIMCLVLPIENRKIRKLLKTLKREKWEAELESLILDRDKSYLLLKEMHERYRNEASHLDRAHSDFLRGFPVIILVKAHLRVLGHQQRWPAPVLRALLRNVEEHDEVAKRLLRSITSKVYLDTIDYTWTYSD
ncbi:hypothetical protein ONZ45_g7365 [Pleurotus djamor]|nr:hypothetical protein ONZ45_g7365 [Pleurotus djamor]